MRRTRTVSRAGITVAAAVVLLTACGGSDAKNSSSSSGTTSAGASTTSANAAGSEFCTQAAAIEASVGKAVADQADPSSIPQALQAAAAQIRAIHPPSEIAADWNALAGGVEQLATAFAAVDFNDQNAVATFEQQASQLEAQLSGSSAKVEKYLSDQCGIQTSTDTSAPAS
jgi:hypothetical protein